MGFVMHSKTLNPKIAQEALKSIRKTAMDHPAFMLDEFERRDIDVICKAGGDCCDWTMIAITADDALKSNET